MKDATDPIRKKAAKLSDEQGTACTQASFKVNKKAFLFIGEQGGRHKAMFKLKASKSEAEKLAKKSPDDFQVGSTAWVTARFSDEHPLPKKVWEKWLKESYELSLAPAKKSSKKSAKKKTAKKKPLKKRKASRKSKKKKE